MSRAPFSQCLRVRVAVPHCLSRQPCLSRVLRALQSPSRGIHAAAGADVPPPLTAPQLRRSSAGRVSAARSPSRTAQSAAAGTLASPVGNWTDVLAPQQQQQQHGPSLSRVALREAAVLCLRVEAPKCYAVYRPCNTSRGGNAPGGVQAAPHHFVDLLRHLRTVPDLSHEARRVAEVLVDLLNKPPHPQCPGPWDVDHHEARELKARALSYAMDSAPDGDAALRWVAELLKLSLASASPTEVDESTAAPAPSLLQMAALERLQGSASTSTARHVRVGEPDGDWLLSSSPAVVGAVAAAMLRSDTDHVKGGALDLLEAAALSRLARRSSPSAAAARESTAGAAAVTSASLPFDEEVAVHCAEVAAVRGDVETVTRLIFLLYRARGALGFATLAEHRRQRRSSSNGGRGQHGWSVGELLRPRAPSWWRAAESAASGEAGTAADADDARFEQAVVRLLKSAMHAVLYHPHHHVDQRDDNVEEALSLWDGLRGGTGWSGLAAMGTEMLRYLVAQHDMLTVAATENASDAAEVRLRRAGMHVYTHLCLAAPPRRRSSAQGDVLHHCATLLVRLHSTTAVLRGGGGNSHSLLPSPAVPVVATTDAAERVLGLFAEASDPLQQEALLPYALAASLTVLSVACTDKTYALPQALFSGLVEYASRVQSLHHYCVASDASATALPGTVVCGGLLLLHACLLACAPLDAVMREESAVRQFLLRIRTLADAGRSTSEEQCHEGTAVPLLLWLKLCGQQQRELLWLLLLSLKRGDARWWCKATLALFASPASSAVIFSAVSSVVDALPQCEAHTALSLLYECGNSDELAVAQRTLDRVVQRCATIPIHTTTLSALTEQLQRVPSSTSRNNVLLVVGVTALRALVQWREPAGLGLPGDRLLALLQLLQPLFHGPATPASPPLVTLILTPASLVELQQQQSEGGDVAAPQEMESVAGKLRSALAGLSPPLPYRVCVASAWPVLPAARPLLCRYSGEQALDGLREGTALARHVEHAFPKEARPVVGLWAEVGGEEAPPLPPPHARHAMAAERAGVLQHYGAREVSLQRAHVEKAKSDIFSLLHVTPAAAAAESTLRVSDSAVAAEADAARRVRNQSLLSVVSHKRKGQRV